jgi:uncharacterized protein
MNWIYSIAFMTGMAGSFHCVGMCGPIALALPVGGQSAAQMATSRILYNIGRILTYSTLGAVFGYFGKSIFIAGYQQQLSIIVGLLMLLSIYPNRIAAFTPFQSFTNKIVATLKKLFNIKSYFGFLLLGMVNGLLPCGLVYVALAAATASVSVYEGALFMAFFGLGTAPLMFSVSVLPKFLKIDNRRKINKFLPIYSLFLAMLFIIRGLGLGIPHLSPKFESQSITKEIPICHVK